MSLFVSKKKSKKGHRASEPKLMPPGTFGQIYRAGTHWMLGTAIPSHLLPVLLSAMKPHLVPGSFLAVLPMPAVPRASVVVVCLPKERNRARKVLESCGFRDRQLDVIEEELASGRDVIALTSDQELGKAIGKAMLAAC